MKFTKGHGTGNDFVIIEDLEGTVELTPALVAALCDRRFGIGGDGVLRVQPSTDPAAVYFMDYWNSDGSLSEMCGNGVRVFARYLHTTGLAGDEIPLSTRGGLRTAYVEGDLVRVDMAPPALLGDSVAVIDGVSYPGLAISMGNPHLVCDVPAEVAEAVDLSRAPQTDPALFPAGVNVEFSVKLAEDHRRMRVYERGSGETMSCGTGATAVGVAALHTSGRDTGTVTVDVPGGRLEVTRDARTSWLAGPAVLTFTGELDPTTLVRRP
ncbi:diaminopimelate epimerase [Catellatospora citrea]|uniref:Diaminopimelate epimerase n=1 Tax=Catellatospora citrea TaxID=53366 RepID=A0A8J3NZ76_9ACTN|nr:diaminopimelate epimerase [Catellatospora citrea]RKE10053.1 diaminopimelate epimerase [Catellatospora citrea]GIF98037.1 diaminopimelate epimerase [Catellatospora citrea]